MKINEKLKYLLKNEGISAAAFARETGIAESTSGHYINGRSQPTHTALEKICSHPRFKKYTMFLMTDDEEFKQVGQDALDSGKPVPKHQELIDVISSLPVDVQQQVRTYAEYLASQKKN